MLSPRTLRRCRRLAVPVLVLAVAVPVATASPASAHDRLTGSTPSAGSTITTSPSRVTLTFTDEVTTIGLTVLVKDPSGGSVTDGPPTTDGTAVLQAIDRPTVPGEYTVAYRVVSSDGHPINGRFAFTLDVPSPSPSASASDSPSPIPTASSAPSGDVVAAKPAASTVDAGGGLVWLIVGAALIVALVLTGLILARRRAA
jgi:methionine-rich copper-binding protein CopC